MPTTIVIQVSEDGEEIESIRLYESHLRAFEALKAKFYRDFAKPLLRPSKDKFLEKIDETSTFDELAKVLKHTRWGRNDLKLYHVVVTNNNGRHVTLF
jgi:hypothetical protein